MSEPRTTITYRGKEYPFYKTNRAKVDFTNAGFTNQQVIEGNDTAILALIFYIMVDCARRNNTPIRDSFEEFIDASDPNIDEVFMRLAEAKMKQNPTDQLFVGKSEEDQEPKKY